MSTLTSFIILVSFVVGLVVVVGGCELIPEALKKRRSDALDRLRTEKIGFAINVAKKIGLLRDIGIICDTTYLQRFSKRYSLDSFGRFIESLLNEFPTEQNYKIVADFLYYKGNQYSNKFLETMIRHTEIFDKLKNEMFHRYQIAKDEKERLRIALATLKHENRIIKDLKICGYKPGGKVED